MSRRNKLLLTAIVGLLGIGVFLWKKKQIQPAVAPPSAAAIQPPAATPAAVQQQAVVAAPQSGAASSVAEPPTKYRDMGVFERNAVIDEIAKKDLPEIFQAMCDAGRVEHDALKQMHLQTLFVEALRAKKPSAEFLEQMAAFVANRSNLKFERDLVFGALKAAATKETVDLLLKMATTSPDQELRESAGSLAGAGSSDGAGEKLSPSLEKAWRDSNDEKLLRGVAATMAEIGTPSGIELLLAAAFAPDSGDKTRQIVARRAMQGITSKKAVPPLAARLANEPPTSETARLLAPILVRIGNDTAGYAVVNWLQNTPENAAPFIKDLIVQRTTKPAMSAAWAAALKPTVKFRNEQNREAIAVALNRAEVVRLPISP